jgi:predicted AlkP superfamily pyrophosphatase or phosphodiesterase
LLTAGCGGGDGGEAAPAPSKVLVIGLDGWEWNVGLPLLREGRLPHLKALMERGVAGELETMAPNKSPALWTSIATGKQALEHGILDFVKERKTQYTSRDRKVKAYWNILGDHGVSSDTIGWWATWPAEEVDGMIVAPTWTPGKGPKFGWISEGVSGQVFPAHFDGLVTRAIEDNEARLDEIKADIFGELEVDLPRRAERMWRESDWAFRTDSTNVSVLETRIASGESSRVLSVYLGGTDIVGHRFWASYEPEYFGLGPDSDLVRAFGHVIPAYYEYVDRVLGALVASLPSETAILVISDHGMTHVDIEEETNLDLYGFTGNHWDLDNPAMFVAAGPGIRARSSTVPIAELTRADLPRLGGIVDFTPTLLALVGVPVGEDMSGVPLEAVLDPAHLALHPLRIVPTHDDPAWLAARAAAPTIEIEDEERLKQLEQLGYLQGEDTDQEE